MSEEGPLTAAEIAELRKVIKYAAEIEAEMELKLAKRLVLKTWRSLIIGLAALVGSFLFLQDTIRKVLSGWLN